MSEFFKSELVRGEIQEMTSLQEFCFRCAMNLNLLDYDRKLEYFDALELLIEKQKIFHARVCLSDDPEAKSVAESIKQAVVLLGGDENLRATDMFDELLGKVREFKDILKSGTES
ncbi:MAG: hypothetical protein CMO44_14875 [Verrucomicrobiales bacterium]|jgi:hypothetical protein|nr:hypothetical protein [Verrucomicrobiales bacterium]|tara:strand:+ start:3789 stop:4133 length:345 start_codon:yes stop_codon:yes gene_type:complete